MKTSTSMPNKPDKASENKPIVYRILAIAFWLFVWQAASVAIGQDILLVSPITVMQTLFRLMSTADFYRSVAVSLGRILLGFSLACVLGIALSVLSARFSFVRTLLDPMMLVIKATPVASFVILALVWIASKNLSIFTSFLMVLPLIYTGVLSGIESVDIRLLEMARVFQMRQRKMIFALYIPAAFPQFLTACQLGLSMCWKAGIAAEVIGQPANSIGDKLYRAKLFLSTDELFAWTLTIIAVSALFEFIVLRLIKRLRSAYVGGESNEI